MRPIRQRYTQALFGDGNTELYDVFDRAALLANLVITHCLTEDVAPLPFLVARILPPTSPNPDTPLPLRPALPSREEATGGRDQGATNFGISHLGLPSCPAVLVTGRHDEWCGHLS
jgi:hypothetical protein